MKIFFARTFAIALVLILSATGLWAAGADEEGSAAAADKKYVTDPTTGKVVTAPEYGGTLTLPYVLVGDTTDPFVTGHYAGFIIDGVNEQLAYGDWGINRQEFDFRNPYLPVFAFTGALAESWARPDPLTYIFHIRKGVHWHDKAPMNGRELNANDVVYTYQRNLALGDFTKRAEQPSQIIDLPWESIEATDKYTVVMKLTKPSLNALRSILDDPFFSWIYPPEVIEKYGDYTDWRNVVGTGPMMLTDYAEGVSKTYTRNPDYWGYDPKYPQNRLPYIDQLRSLYMADEATRISALRTGKVDMLHQAGAVNIRAVDVVRSLRKTNPEIEVHSYYSRASGVFGLNMHKPPFDDVRVRHAMQMALDLETINDTYFAGYGRWEPMGGIAVKPYVNTFKDFPEGLKQYYRYDPEGAEKLLDEAGYPRGADGVRLKVNYDHRDVVDLGYAEIAASYWADIGVEVTTNILDTATWVANRGEHNYEMTVGDSGFYLAPSIWVNHYRTDVLFLREYVGGVQTPELTAAYDAFFAATTEEERVRAYKEYDMLILKQHNQIWGPMAPGFEVNQPWVKGYNGEFSIGNMLYNSVLVRLWIDQDLKREMGF